MMPTKLNVIDVGNSTIRFGEFSSFSNTIPLPQSTLEIPSRPVEKLAAEFESLHNQTAADHWFGVSVFREANEKLTEWLTTSRPSEPIKWLTANDFPIDLDVQYPEKLGLDRIAAGLAAARMKAASNAAIVVDAGTATKVDVVSVDNVFLGGVIMPGRTMMARSLREQTDALPEIPIDDEPPTIIGRWTEEAIRSGNFWGTIGAVRYFIERIRSDLRSDVDVFLCGGSMRTMHPHIDAKAKYCPNLVLTGVALAARESYASDCL